MAIGMGVGETNHDTPLLSILQAISGGTFIYLACCDLIIHEFHNSENDEHGDEQVDPVPAKPLTEAELK